MRMYSISALSRNRHSLHLCNPIFLPIPSDLSPLLRISMRLDADVDVFRYHRNMINPNIIAPPIRLKAARESRPMGYRENGLMRHTRDNEKLQSRNATIKRAFLNS